MANDLDSNPIYIDTVAADIDIASGHVGVSDATMFIDRVVFEGATLNDVFVLKNALGKQVLKITASAAGDQAARELDGFPCQGLQALSADQTVTSGNILIYMR